MEQEDLTVPQIWETLSSEECASVSCSFLPELSSPENHNSSWPSSTVLQRPIFPEEHDFLVSCQELDYRKLDLINPESPCSPLLFNLLQPSLCERVDFLQACGPLQPRTIDHEVQAADLYKSEDRNSAEAESGVKQEQPTEQSDECQPAKRRCTEKKSSRLDASSTKSLVSLTEVAAFGHALNTDGKPRARRGSATDPQSVYARHRRERINERLRTLQALVPNGGKVDIVTMLEEAINYVKFLQLQVKLLSSDEHWMYAPTTYNGMNISLGMHLGIQSFMSQAQV